MNKEHALRIAQECHLIGMRPHLDGIYEESLVRFATLVAAAEREECAKVCDELAAKDKLSNYYKVAARAIRERT